MAVYYKFKSAKDYDSIAIDGHFISVATLKEKIYESKQLGRGTDYDLVVTNAQTNEEYLDEAMLIPKNTSVLIRRLPGRPRMPIVTAPVTDQDELKVENVSENVQPSSYLGADSSAPNYPFDLEYDEFGNDLYEIPEVAQAPSSNHVQDAPPPSKADEDSKIRALIDTPALDWQRQTADGFGPGRGFGRGMGGRMGGRGFGRGGGGGLERKTPPQGYVCHRCNKPGHFIQHCPTNGDPTFDVKRVKPPTGIPKSMLMATPDGSYALPSGAVAVLKPNEAAFEKEIEGMPSTRHVGELPPELHCPLCKQVMKDAVLTSKCCFKSFCDKCIRDYIISKSACVCGATNVLADDLLPNKTLRDTINRILESNNDSGENGGSAFQVQDMESARCPPPKLPSPSLSAASKGEKAPPQHEEITKVQETVEHDKTADAQQPVVEKGKVAKVPDVSEATHESRSMKEPAASQGSIRPDEEVQQKPAPAEAAKKKKKKKTQLTMTAAEMQWRASQDLAAENYMMPMGGMQQPYNPYWNGMHPGMEAFVGPFGGGAMPFMGYGLGPMDIPFGGMPPPDPFGGPGGFMMPPAFPPQRDLAEFAMGMNGGMHGGMNGGMHGGMNGGMHGGMNGGGPPMMSREEFEARKAELKRKREFERRGMNGGGRELMKDREFGREREVSSSADISSMKSKPKSIPPPPPSSRVDNNHDYHRHRSERPSPDRRSRDPEPPRPSSKRKSTDRHHDDYEYEDDRHHHRHQHHSHRRSESSAAATRPPPPPPQSEPQKSTTVSSKSKPSVFSRISFPEGEAAAAAAASKKRKLTSSSSEAGGVGGGSSHRRDSSSKDALSNGYHEEQHHHKSSSSSAAARKSSAAAAAAAVLAVDADYESSDDDRHFKRRPAKERERDRGREDRDRSSYSKHR